MGHGVPSPITQTSTASRHCRRVASAAVAPRIQQNRPLGARSQTLPPWSSRVYCRLKPRRIRFMILWLRVAASSHGTSCDAFTCWDSDIVALCTLRLFDCAASPLICTDMALTADAFTCWDSEIPALSQVRLLWRRWEAELD